MSQEHTSGHHTNDELLRALARQLEQDRQIERERLDESWERLAAGTLAGPRRAELEARAAKDEETRTAYEAFRPLGGEFRQRVVGALLEQREAERSRRPAPADAAAPEEDERGAKVLPFRRARRLVGGGIAAAALAASLVFVFLPPASVAPLADYDLRLAPGLQSERSTPAAPTAEPLFVIGMDIELVLRPATRIEGEVEAELFLESASGELRPFTPARTERADSGAIRVAATVGEDLDLAPGRYTLHVVVGRPGALPEGDPRALPSAGEGWRYLRGSLRIGQNP